MHAATVQQLRPFGAFVKLEGYRKYGLVHVSQVGWYRMVLQLHYLALCEAGGAPQVRPGAVSQVGSALITVV